MSDSKHPIGCLGLLVVALFLATFAFVFYRITSMKIWGAPEITHQSQSVPKLPQRIGEVDGPDFTTMDAQLLLAQEKKQTITQFRLEGSLVPLDGPWTVKEVGYDVVILEGPAGSMTIRMEAIVGILVKPETAPAPSPEPQVEK